MSSNAAADPAFFKILTMKDFSTVLRIPPAFWAKHKSDMRGNAKVVVDCGRIWNVKMERNGSVICFTRGWSKFVEDAALQFGEFLVFTLTGNSQFHVNYVPVKFVKASGLDKKTDVKMEYVGNGNGNGSVVVVVAVENRLSKLCCVELGIGWFQFRHESKLVFGKMIYSFEFHVP